MHRDAIILRVRNLLQDEIVNVNGHQLDGIKERMDRRRRRRMFPTKRNVVQMMDLDQPFVDMQARRRLQIDREKWVEELNCPDLCFAL